MSRFLQRPVIQGSCLLCCLWLGIRFARFIDYFATGRQGPIPARPAGVEGFLPIGALVSLKHWLVGGRFDTVHPAALVILLTVLALTVVAGKAFCSWLCPVGTVSTALAALGRRLLGRNLLPPTWLDLPLRAGKYLLLAFFLKIVLLDMPAAALAGFLASPYWAVSDIRMLHFFTRPTPLLVAVLAILAGLSLLIRDAWCRYLCPYGALLGLVAQVAPLRVRRREEACNGCQQCSRACPSRLQVDHKKAVHSPECTACLRCVASCPEPGALALGLPGAPRPWLTPPRFALLVVVLFAGGLLVGMMSGHWQTALPAAAYRQLVPLAERLGH